MKITQFDNLYPDMIALGGTTLVSSSGSNSGFTGGDVLGEPGDLSVVGLRRQVSLQSNLSSGASIGDVLTIVQVAGDVQARFATSSNSNSIASPLTTKGDLWSWGSNNARFAVGSNGTGIVADASHDLGLRWTLRALSGELLMQDGVTAPPVPVESDPGQDDWLYADL